MNSPWKFWDVSSLGSSNPRWTRIFLGIFVDFYGSGSEKMGSHWIQWEEIMGYWWWSGTGFLHRKSGDSNIEQKLEMFRWFLCKKCGQLNQQSHDEWRWCSKLGMFWPFAKSTMPRRRRVDEATRRTRPSGNCLVAAHGDLRGAQMGRWQPCSTVTRTKITMSIMLPMVTSYLRGTVPGLWLISFG